MMRRSRAAAALESRTMAATSAAIKVGKFEREREGGRETGLAPAHREEKGFFVLRRERTRRWRQRRRRAAKVKGMKSARIFFLRRRRRRVAKVCCHRACDRDRPRPPARPPGVTIKNPKMPPA